MANISNLRICVIDNIGGSYLNIALKLSPYFSKTYYWSNNQSPFPRISLSSVGSGFEQIEVLKTFWDNLDQFDLVVIPDIYFTGYAPALRKLGKLVFGGSPSEVLETDRKLFKETLERLNLPVVPYTYIKGINNLKKYLSTKQNLWVKISYWRGEVETFNYINKTHSGNIIEELLFNLGDLESEIECIVEKPLESIAEVGFDGYFVAGQYGGIEGIECKNVGYVGKAQNIFPPVTNINNAFSKVLQAYGHIGLYSTEIRYTAKGEAYYIDPCMRAGMPPSNVYLELISNWNEIIPAAAQGEFVEPKYKATYGCEIILKSSYVNTNYLNITFPPEYADNIALKGAFKTDGQISIIPFKKFAGYELEEVGSVVVIGNDLQQILSRAVEIAGSVEGYDLRFDENALEKVMASIAETEKCFEIKF